METEFGQAADKAMQMATQAPYQSFVDFTTGLIGNVFQALVRASREQITAYVDLLNAVADGRGKFVEATAIEYLNRHILPAWGADEAAKVLDDEIAPDATPEARMVKVNNGVPPAFENVKVKDKKIGEYIKDQQIDANDLIKFAEEVVAQSAERSFDELQTLLRMGMVRVIPNKGFIETAATFNFSSTDEGMASTSDRTSEASQTDKGGSFGGYVRGGYGSQSGSLCKSAFSLLGGFIGGAIGGEYRDTSSTSKYTVHVLNENSSNAVHLDINIAGRVRVEFVTDYFPAMPAAVPVAPQAIEVR